MTSSPEGVRLQVCRKLDPSGWWTWSWRAVDQDGTRIAESTPEASHKTAADALDAAREEMHRRQPPRWRTLGTFPYTKEQDAPQNVATNE